MPFPFTLYSYLTSSGIPPRDSKIAPRATEEIEEDRNIKDEALELSILFILTFDSDDELNNDIIKI
jgi:hypothetical protein